MSSYTKNGNQVMEKISEGMKVYDWNNEEVGTVSYVQFTDEDPTLPGPETASAPERTDHYEDTIMGKITDALTGGAKLPEEMRQRMMREGFVCIDVGPLRSDRYALPNQIHHVTSEAVHLNVTGDELIHSL